MEDYVELSDDHLDKRIVELTETAQLPHTEERRAAIAAELNHALFEHSCRLVDGGAQVL